MTLLFRAIVHYYHAIEILIKKFKKACYVSRGEWLNVVMLGLSFSAVVEFAVVISNSEVYSTPSSTLNLF